MDEQMEYGRSARRYTPHTGHDFAVVRRTALDIARAAAHVHSLGAIHGDLKPRNVVRVRGTYVMAACRACLSLCLSVLIEVADQRYASCYG